MKVAYSSFIPTPNSQAFVKQMEKKTYLRNLIMFMHLASVINIVG